MSQLPDEEAQFRNSYQEGEEQAFNQLFREYYAPLTYFANKLVNHTAEAEDIVQECFVRIWKKRPDVENIKAYLYTSVRNACFQHLRNVARRAITITSEPYEPSIERYLVMAETAREVLKLIQSLSPKEQEVIRLYYLEGKSLQEVSKLLGKSYSAVKTQRRHALLMLGKNKKLD